MEEQDGMSESLRTGRNWESKVVLMDPLELWELESGSEWKQPLAGGHISPAVCLVEKNYYF